MRPIGEQHRPTLRRGTEAMMRLGGIDAQGSADVPRRENARGGSDDLVELGFRQRHAFVQDAGDLESTLQQLTHKLLTGDRIVRQVVMRLPV